MSATRNSIRGRSRWHVGTVTIGLALAACSASDAEKHSGPDGVSPVRASDVSTTLRTIGTASTTSAATDPHLLEWRTAIKSARRSKSGCFHASYPSTAWTEVPCGPPPVGAVPSHGPHRPAPVAEERKDEARSSAPTPFTGGAGGDYFAQFPGPINGVTGSFPSVTGATAPGGYTIQLNSNSFTIPSTNPTCPNCSGWQQGIYSPRQGNFIQFWLLNQSPCPNGWTTSNGGCYQNGAALPAPSVAMSDLSTMVMEMESDATSDTLFMTIAGEAYEGSSASVLGLGQNLWTSAEWGIFGDGGGTNVTLTPNTTIVGRIVADEPPSCTTSASGATAETNNLNEICCVNSPNLSAIQFEESTTASQACTICGNQGQACCNSVGPAPACASASNLCYDQTCVHCGGNGELCCNGPNTCTAAGTICQTEGHCSAPDSLVTNPTTLSVANSDGAGTSVNHASTLVTASGGWAGSVAPLFAFAGTPAGVTCTGSSDVAPSTGPSTVTCTASENTPIGTYPIAVKATIGAFAPITISLSLTVTRCQPLTCSEAGYSCGSIDTGCGETVSCGSCPSGELCTSGACFKCAERSCPPPEFFNLNTCRCQACPCGTLNIGGHLECAVCRP